MITFQNFLVSVKPKSNAASCNNGSIFSNDVYIGNTMKGRYVNTIPKMIAKSVPIILGKENPKIEDKIFSDLNTDAKALILSKKLVHIGNININNTKYLFLIFDLYREYEINTPKNIQIAVVITAYLIEFKNATNVDFSVRIVKFVIVASIPPTDIPSESTNIRKIITTTGTNANKYNQNRYGLDILSR